MTYVKISPKMKAKDLKALPDLVATLGRITDDDTKKADAAFDAMPAKLTAGQRRALRAGAASCRKTIRSARDILSESARFYDRLAKVGKLTVADRRLLRHRLANIKSLEFVKL